MPTPTFATCRTSCPRRSSDTSSSLQSPLPRVSSFSLLWPWRGQVSCHLCLGCCCCLDVNSWVEWNPCWKTSLWRDYPSFQTTQSETLLLLLPRKWTHHQGPLLFSDCFSLKFRVVLNEAFHCTTSLISVLTGNSFIWWKHGFDAHKTCRKQDLSSCITKYAMLCVLHTKHAENKIYHPA